MATTSKNKAASSKSLRNTATAAAKKTDGKVQSKKAAPAARLSPKKPSTKPTPSVKKPAAAAPSKKGGRPAPQTKTTQKGAIPLRAPIKDLSKKLVKTAPVSKASTKPAPKATAKPAAAAEAKKPRLNKADLDQFKVDLIAMRDRITGQSGSMRNDALQRTDEINPEEDGTDAFMRLQTLEQVSSQQQIITNIDEALRAIDKGSYGVCDNCGDLINKPRLTVLPFAKNCIKCQSEMERANRPGGRR